MGLGPPRLHNRPLSSCKPHGISDVRPAPACCLASTSAHQGARIMSKRTAAIVAAVLIAAVVSVYLVAGSMANRIEPPTLPGDGVVRVRSAYALPETIARLKKDVAAKGIMMFFTVDQAKARRRRRHQAAALHAAGVRQPGARRAVHHLQSAGGARLARPAAGAGGRHGLGVGDLHRLCLDLAAAPHHRPRARLQDGLQRDCLHHLECRSQMTGRSQRAGGGG